MSWNAKNIPDLTGKIIIITGANRGLGFEVSLQLAKKNATLVIACRNRNKGDQAINRIKQILNKDINALTIPLDVSDINSVKTFASSFKERFYTLDVLITNAAVVSLKEKQVTASGIEMHMATNHYGNFALLALLYPYLIQTPNSRVVTVSSGSHKFGNLDFNDLNWEKRPYNPSKSYGDSKLANLIFARSLQKKFDNDNSSALSVAAHPGLSATKRQQATGFGGWFSQLLAQPVWKGALPILRAATDPNANALDYYGPRFGISGYPTHAKMDKKAFNLDVAKQLWQKSEQITGLTF